MKMSQSYGHCPLESNLDSYRTVQCLKQYLIFSQEGHIKIIYIISTASGALVVGGVSDIYIYIYI